MAILTALDHGELAAAAAAFGITLVHASGQLAGSVNTLYVVDDDRGERWFFRVYEEQDEAGAARQARLLVALGAAGVPTPIPRARADGGGFVGSVRGKPLSVFPRAAGRHRCQAGVSARDAHRVGVELARMHRVGDRIDADLTGESRFSIDAIAARLSGLPPDLSAEVAAARDLLGARVDDLRAWTPRARPLPLVHGDLFRDNVLFDEGGRVTLLDFESASRGGAAFDLAVTLLAWCFGDALDPRLAAAMVEGYLSVRALTADEIADLAPSAQLACVRFATTRITDYELRPPGACAYKDYRRWLARLATVERLFGLREAPPDSTLRSVWPT